MIRTEYQVRHVATKDYVHSELNQEVLAIGGCYRLVKEARVPFKGRKVLFLLGHAAFDTSCCGAGGCAYALVPGFVASWKACTNADGEAISQVQPIRDEGVRQEVQQLIEQSEVVHQVIFL